MAPRFCVQCGAPLVEAEAAFCRGVWPSGGFGADGGGDARGFGPRWGAGATTPGSDGSECGRGGAQVPLPLVADSGGRRALIVLAALGLVAGGVAVGLAFGGDDESAVNQVIPSDNSDQTARRPAAPV